MKRLKRALVLLMVTAMAAAMFSGCGKKEETDGVVDIFDYVTVDFAGENGSGTATVNIDYDGLETEMVGGEDKLKELDSVDDLGTLTSYINVVSSMSFSVDKSSELSNGDTITVSVTYDESAASEAEVTIGDELSHTYEVKGLK